MTMALQVVTLSPFGPEWTAAASSNRHLQGKGGYGLQGMFIRGFYKGTASRIASLIS